MKNPMMSSHGRKPISSVPISERPLSGDSALMVTPAWVRSVVSWPWSMNDGTSVLKFFTLTGLASPGGS